MIPIYGIFTNGSGQHELILINLKLKKAACCFAARTNASLSLSEEIEGFVIIFSQDCIIILRTEKHQEYNFITLYTIGPKWFLKKIRFLNPALFNLLMKKITKRKTSIR